MTALRAVTDVSERCLRPWNWPFGPTTTYRALLLALRASTAWKAMHVPFCGKQCFWEVDVHPCTSTGPTHFRKTNNFSSADSVWDYSTLYGLLYYLYTITYSRGTPWEHILLRLTLKTGSDNFAPINFFSRHKITFHLTYHSTFYDEVDF